MYFMIILFIALLPRITWEGLVVNVKHWSHMTRFWLACVWDISIFGGLRLPHAQKLTSDLQNGAWKGCLAVLCVTSCNSK